MKQNRNYFTADDLYERHSDWSGGLLTKDQLVIFCLENGLIKCGPEDKYFYIKEGELYEQ